MQNMRHVFSLWEAILAKEALSEHEPCIICCSEEHRSFLFGKELNIFWIMDMLDFFICFSVARICTTINHGKGHTHTCSPYHPPLSVSLGKGKGKVCTRARVAVFEWLFFGSKIELAFIKTDGISKQHKRIKKVKRKKDTNKIRFRSCFPCSIVVQCACVWVQKTRVDASIPPPPLIRRSEGPPPRPPHTKKDSHFLSVPRFGVDRRGKRGSSERKYCLSARKVLFKSVSKVLLFLLFTFSAHLLHNLQLCVSPLNKGCNRAYYYCGLSTRFFSWFAKVWVSRKQRNPQFSSYSHYYLRAVLCASRIF